MDLEDYNIDSRKFESSESILYKTINILMILLKSTIDNQDFNTFNEIQSNLTDSLSIYRPDIMGLWDRKDNIELEIENLKKNKSRLEISKSELVLVDKLLEFPQKMEIKLNISWFEAASYIIKKIDNQRVFEEHYKYVKILLYKLQGFDILLKTIESINKQLEYELDLNIWEEIPTKGKAVIITDERLLLTFCLRGLQLIEEVNNESTYPSDLIRSRIDGIKKMCNKLVQESDKWNWFVGPELENEVDKFIEMCLKSAKNAEKKEKIK